MNTKLGATRLGSTALEISRLGFGAWAIGGDGYEFGWPAQEERQSVETIWRGLELGINWIDTSNIYGLGRSGGSVGRAIEGLNPRPYVFTKASLVDQGGGPESATTSRATRSFESQLRAWVGSASTPSTSIKCTGRFRTKALKVAFAELKEQGLVRNIGVCNFDVDQLRRIQGIAEVQTLQSPYSLIAREVESHLLAYAPNEGLGVLVYSPMGSGLLTGKMTRQRVARLPESDWRKHSERFQEPALSAHLEVAERLQAIAGRHQTTPGAIAVAWTLRHPAVAGAIVGFRRPEQIDPILEALELEVSGESLADLAVQRASDKRRDAMDATFREEQGSLENRRAR